MGTMAVRAVLAGAFIAAAGALGGVQAWPGAPEQAAMPTMAAPHPGAPMAMPDEGWITRVLVRSCEHSLGASSRDRSGAAARRSQCERNHGAVRGGQD